MLHSFLPKMTAPLKLIVGLGLCTIGGAMLLTYFRRKDGDRQLPSATASATTTTTTTTHRNARQPHAKEEVTCTFEIRNEHVPIVAGRSGTNIDSIEGKTKTRITFRNKDDNYTICCITGPTIDAVTVARTLLHNEIEQSPVITERILVPNNVCGKILGRCDETMQEICRVSLAKITHEAAEQADGAERRRFTITGNRQQVNIARKLLEDKIEEGEEVRRVVEEVEQCREPRRSPPSSLSSSQASLSGGPQTTAPLPDRLLSCVDGGRTLDVFVSAVVSPSQFWVQLAGSQSKKLDNLVQAMSDYYGQVDNRMAHAIREPFVGQIVAAVFQYDAKWYRAVIVGISTNLYNKSEMLFDLFFLDYGDNQYVKPNEVYELRPDFLMLRYQAIECFLANVRSTTTADPGDRWEKSSIEKFEDLTQVANWKKLTLRAITYKMRPSNAIAAIKKLNNDAAREYSPIPGVELFDVTDGIEVNIGNALIAQGYALPVDGQMDEDDMSEIAVASAAAAATHNNGYHHHHHHHHHHVSATPMSVDSTLSDDPFDVVSR